MSTKRPLLGRKILIQIHERIIPRDCGIHQRVWQVIDGLQDLGAEVHVIASCGPRPERALWTEDSKRMMAERGIRLHLSPFHIGSPDFWLAAAAYVWTKKVRRQVMAWPSSLYYFRPQLQTLWRRVLVKEGIDVAMLNFAYWHRLARSARSLGVWTVIEMIDLLADQYAATHSAAKGGQPAPAETARFALDECHCLGTADCVLAINPDEGAYIRERLKVPVIDLPFCMQEHAPSTVSAPESDILVVGSMIEHNKRGLRDFIAGAWPAIKAVRPDVRLTVCGRVGEDLEPDPNIVQLTRVPDLTPHYHGAKIVLLTTVSGAGIKIKAIEALAHHSCIVAHHHSVKGTLFEDGVHGRSVANLASSAGLILHLLDNLNLRLSFKANAACLFKEHFHLDRGLAVLARVFSCSLTR